MRLIITALAEIGYIFHHGTDVTPTGFIVVGLVALLLTTGKKKS
jgi:hypothetical protein